MRSELFFFFFLDSDEQTFSVDLVASTAVRAELDVAVITVAPEEILGVPGRRRAKRISPVRFFPSSDTTEIELAVAVRVGVAIDLDVEIEYVLTGQIAIGAEMVVANDTVLDLLTASRNKADTHVEVVATMASMDAAARVGIAIDHAVDVDDEDELALLLCLLDAA